MNYTFSHNGTKRMISNRNEHGQSMVELALTITMLMILLGGTVDFGRAFFTWLTIRDAAQEDASYGVINPSAASETELKNRIYDNLRQLIPNPETDVVISLNYITQRCQGNTIKVDINYPNFPITMPFLGTLLGSQTIPIHATVNDSILTPSCP